jgi:hypothetical protein
LQCSPKDLIYLLFWAIFTLKKIKNPKKYFAKNICILILNFLSLHLHYANRHINHKSECIHPALLIRAT